jgi:hypothetical protein
MPALAVVEHVFQRHHRCGLRVGVWAEDGRQHSVYGLALVTPELAEYETRSCTGCVRPAVPQVVVGDRANRVIALVTAEQTNILVRGVGDLVQHHSNL